MTIGERISQQRKEKKLSQEEVAEALFVSRQAVSKWENDQSSPDTENLIALAKLLGVEVEYLVSGDMQDERPEAIPSPKKRKFGLLHFLLILLLCFAAVFLALWQGEKSDMSEMDELIETSAYSCRQNLLSASQENSRAYYMAVADFRCFMQSWYQRWGDGAHDEYLCFNVIYSYMVSEPEKLYAQKADLLEMLDLYSRNTRDLNAYNHLYRIYIYLLHG